MSSTNLDQPAKTLSLFLRELQAQPNAWKTEFQRKLANKNPEFFRKKGYDELIAHISKNSFEENNVFPYTFFENSRVSLH